MTVTPGELKAKVNMIQTGLSALSNTASEPSAENPLLMKLSSQVDWLSNMRTVTHSYRETLETWQFYLEQVLLFWNGTLCDERNDDHNKFLGCLQSLLMIKRVCDSVCDRLDVIEVDAVIDVE